MKKIIIVLLASSGLISLHFTTKEKKLPKYDHIVIVIEENHSFDQIIGSSNAPYINTLAKEGAVFTDAHGVAHPSQPNYIALFSGSTQGISDDRCLKDTLFNSPNLGSALIKEGYTFSGYSQSIPSTGFPGCYYQISQITGSYLYARKHCPWVNWQGNGENQFPASLSKPMSDFPSDFSKLPTVSFVVPDMDNDMHNTDPKGDTVTIRKGDNWLKKNLARYVKWAKKNNSLLILTFDEDDFKIQNHISTIFVGSKVQPGRYNDRIDHYDLLRTIEAIYQLPNSGPAKGKPITNVWKN
ncbi:MAG TPA: alkaline phosphatase family protein [Chitinophagaceae bacterium]|nr:alkaline phosphatase family protein [Chitinophagaceae bacterium]